MKNALIATGIVAACALAFFWFRSGSSSESPETKARTNEASSTSRAGSPSPPRRMRGGENDVVGPRRYSGDQNSSTGSTRSYVRDDGTAVRDHRGGDREPNLDRRPTLPKELSKVQPETLRAVRLALRPAMKKCIAALGSGAEEGAKAQAVLTVSIQNEELNVDELDFQTEGLPLESEASLRECAEAAMLGHKQPIAGSPDVQKHVMTFPYDL